MWSLSISVLWFCSEKVKTNYTFRDFVVIQYKVRSKWLDVKRKSDCELPPGAETSLFPDVWMTENIEQLYSVAKYPAKV